MLNRERLLSAHIPGALICAAEDIPTVQRSRGTLEAESVVKLTCGKYQFPGKEDRAEKCQLNLDASGKFLIPCERNAYKFRLHDPFTVEVEAFESVQNKPWPDTDTESDGMCLITV